MFSFSEGVVANIHCQYIKMFVLTNVCSLSDGPVGESTGTPYIYATPLEISFHDLKVNPQASITMSLAQVQISLKLEILT